MSELSDSSLQADQSPSCKREKQRGQCHRHIFTIIGYKTESDADQILLYKKNMLVHLQNQIILALMKEIKLDLLYCRIISECFH